MPYSNKADKAANSRKWWEANKEKARASRRKSYLRNKEKELAANKRYWEDNRSRLNFWQREYYEANKERLLLNKRAYERSHRHVKNAAWNRYRANKLSAPGSFTTEQWLDKVRYHGWKCLYCFCHLTIKTLTMDHRKPLSRGGSNWVANLAPACRSCNCRKQAKYLRPNWGR